MKKKFFFKYKQCKKSEKVNTPVERRHFIFIFKVKVKNIDDFYLH